MEEKDSLASELLHLVKTQARRWFIAFIVVLIMLFATNLAWLYAQNLPSEESTSESYDIQSEDNGNAVYSESGGVNIGTSESIPIAKELAENELAKHFDVDAFYNSCTCR